MKIEKGRTHIIPTNNYVSKGACMHLVVKPMPQVLPDDLCREVGHFVLRFGQLSRVVLLLAKRSGGLDHSFVMRGMNRDPADKLVKNINKNISANASEWPEMDRILSDLEDYKRLNQERHSLIHDCLFAEADGSLAIDYNGTLMTPVNIAGATTECDRLIPRFNLFPLSARGKSVVHVTASSTTSSVDFMKPMFWTVDQKQNGLDRSELA